MGPITRLQFSTIDAISSLFLDQWLHYYTVNILANFVSDKLDGGLETNQPAMVIVSCRQLREKLNVLIQLLYRNMMQYDALASLGAAGLMDIHALAQWISKLLVKTHEVYVIRNTISLSAFSDNEFLVIFR